VSDSGFFPSINPYNPTTTATPIICHVGYQSCFYRALKPGSARDLELIAQKTYDPKAAYKK